MNVQVLFDKSKKLDYTESNGMNPVPYMKGPGFFPGCTGTIDGSTELGEKPVMVLGQDFDTEKNYKELTSAGEVHTNPTWRNLKKLLADLAIDSHQCFFTNAYMGLRPDTVKNTGKSPAATAEAFSKECRLFFQEQLRLLRPELVLVLGKETARFVAGTFPGYLSKWNGIGTLRDFYQSPDDVCVEMTFDERTIRFLFVIHPSLSGTNRSRIWGKETGRQKEIDLLRGYLPVRN